MPGNKGAAGAKISVYAAGTDQLLWYEQVATYDFQVATSYYGYGETERHFGLGIRASVDVVVAFPTSGRVTRINSVGANQTLRVLESAGSAPTTQALALSSPLQSSGASVKNTNRSAKFDRADSGDIRNTVTAIPSDKRETAITHQSSTASPRTTSDRDNYSRFVDELLAKDFELFDQ